MLLAACVRLFQVTASLPQKTMNSLELRSRDNLDHFEWILLPSRFLNKMKSCYSSSVIQGLLCVQSFKQLCSCLFAVHPESWKYKLEGRYVYAYCVIRFGAQTVALAHTIMNTDRCLQLVRVLNLNTTVEAGLADRGSS